MQEVKAQLDQDETDYEAAAKLGPDALPHLLRLVQDGDPGMASKATYLAATIDGDQSLPVIEQAAKSANPMIRVAAAGALSRLQRVPDALARALLDDGDAGIRHLSLQALEIHLPAGFKAKVEEMRQRDPDGAIRAIAADLVNRLP